METEDRKQLTLLIASVVLAGIRATGNVSTEARKEALNDAMYLIDAVEPETKK